MDVVWMVTLVDKDDDYEQGVYVRGGSKRSATVLARIASSLGEPRVRVVHTATWDELDATERVMFGEGNVAVFEPEWSQRDRFGRLR